MDDSDIAMHERRLATAIRAVKAAGLELERRRTAENPIRSQSDAKNVVSEADLASAKLIASLVSEDWPDDPMVCEELGHTGGSSDHRWVIDPLDGTANYIHQLPLWAVSVAYEGSDGSILGAVYDALHRRVWDGASGDFPVDGMERSPRLRTAHVLREAMVGGFRSVSGELAASRFARLQRAFEAVGQERDFGSAALTLAWTARGYCDVTYFETPDLKEWDFLAGLAICRGSGIDARRLLPAGPGLPERIVAGEHDLVDELLKRIEED